MRIHDFPWLVLAISLIGCRDAPPPSPFQPVADVKQLMASILEPAADSYWDAVGTVDDEKGTTYFAPRSSEDWIVVRNNALVIAESGNLLMMPTRTKDHGDWMAMSQELIKAGRRALAAAEARDTVAVFDAGAEVYEACTKCHAKYAVPLAKPSTQDE